MLVEIRFDRNNGGMVLLILMDIVLLDLNVVTTPLRVVHRSYQCCSDDVGSVQHSKLYVLGLLTWLSKPKVGITD